MVLGRCGWVFGATGRNPLLLLLMAMTLVLSSSSSVYWLVLLVLRRAHAGSCRSLSAHSSSEFVCLILWRCSPTSRA